MNDYIDFPTGTLSECWERSVLLLLLVGLLTGCDNNPRYVVSSFTLQRGGWESVEVDASFARKTLLGENDQVQPDSITVQLFSADYDTLAVSSDLHAAIPDVHLRSREPVMVEVCGLFEMQAICEQEALQASPKRVTAQHSLTYPEDGNFERGRYDISFIIERQRFRDSTWERIHTNQLVDAHLRVYVAGRRDEYVDVPLRTSRGKFQLARYDNYDDFSYHLTSQLYEADSARVRFDLYAGFKGDPSPRVQATMERKVRKTRPEEHESAIRYFAAETAQQLIGQMTDEEIRPRVSITEWTYNHITQRYEISVRIDWEGSGFLFRDSYRLEGLLQVERGGFKPRFRLRRGSGGAQRLWDERISDRVVRLEGLGVPEEEEEQLGPRRYHSRRAGEREDSFRW